MFSFILDLPLATTQPTDVKSKTAIRAAYLTDILVRRGKLAECVPEAEDHGPAIVTVKVSNVLDYMPLHTARKGGISRILCWICGTIVSR